MPISFLLSFFDKCPPVSLVLQDCMDFCAKHKIVPNIKLVKVDELDQVYATLMGKNDQVQNMHF